MISRHENVSVQVAALGRSGEGRQMVATTQRRQLIRSENSHYVVLAFLLPTNRTHIWRCKSWEIEYAWIMHPKLNVSAGADYRRSDYLFSGAQPARMGTPDTGPSFMERSDYSRFGNHHSHGRGGSRTLLARASYRF
jgi:hypothetical protein